MNIYQNDLYMEDVKNVGRLNLPWDRLKDKSIMISGATGLLGSFLVDVLLEKNITDELNCTVYALGRSEERTKTRFSKYVNESHLVYVRYDVIQPLQRNDIGTTDYVLHLASHTHPMQYSTDPIGTIMINILGLQNMLDFAVKHRATRFAFASSNEIYGENRGDTEFFDEAYFGYINCNTLRAGYPESKRCGEALCQAYMSQRGLDVVIPRFTRSYGPTMLRTDTKAISQFINKAINGEDIVLKSAGTQLYSYTYVADAISGLLTILLSGKRGEAYNIADEKSDITLKDLASIIAGMANRKVVYEIPDSVEAAGYSTATKARLNGDKLKHLGWRPRYEIQTGIKRTLGIIKEL